MPVVLKGSLRASFFLVFSFIFSANLYGVSASPYPKQSETDALASSDQWHALLHLHKGQPLINDPNFILSIKDFSPAKELMATLDFLTNPNNNHCQFIARHQFLQTHFPHIQIAKKLNCSQYQKFRSSAPSDEVSIIYTSENLTQPSSMMGHTMLGIAGLNKHNQQVEHSVSFLTELDSLNVASIIWGTFYVGKEGFFIVKPLQQTLDEYLVKEQRNIWRYVLDIPSEQKALMHKHIWELNQAKIDYLFHRHNCSTLSQYILNVALPKMQPSTKTFISPVDVIKTAQDFEIIDNTLMYPSSKWKIRMLSDFVDEEDIQQIKHGQPQMTIHNETLTVDVYLKQLLAKTYAQYQYEQGQLNSDVWAMVKAGFDNSPATQAGYQIDLQDYQSPLKTPDDSHLALGIINSQDRQWLSLGWLPASHTLEDNNSQYFSENELKLNELVLKMDTTTGEIDLQRWHIYSAKSLTPYDTLTGGLSGSFSLGFDEVYDRQLDSKTNLFVRGGIGHTQKVNRDFSLYYLMNIGTTLHEDESSVFLEPEIGAYLYEVWDMKTWFSLKQNYNSNGYQQFQWDIKQSFMKASDSSFIAAFSHIKSGSISQSVASVQYRFYY